MGQASALRSKAAILLLLGLACVLPSNAEPIATDGTYELVRLRLLIADDRGDIQEVEAIGAVLRIRFDGPLHLEHFNGSFHYWPLDSLPHEEPAHEALFDGLTRLECINRHQETGEPEAYWSSESVEDVDSAYSHAHLFPLYWGLKPFRPVSSHAHHHQKEDVSDLLHHLLVRGGTESYPWATYGHANNTSAGSSSSSTPSEYAATILLQVEDMDGSLHQSPMLLPRLLNPTPAQREIYGLSRLHRTLSGCRMRFIAHDEQKFWPLRALVDARAHRVSPEARTRLRQWDRYDSAGQSTPMAIAGEGNRSSSSSRTTTGGRKAAIGGSAPPTVDVLLSMQGLQAAQTDGVRAHHSEQAFARHYPRVYAGWHSAVPPMPPFCGLANGSLSEATAQELREHHEMSFIETRTKARGIPFLDKILDMVMKIIMPGIMDPFLGNLETHTANTLGPEMSHQVNAETPSDIITKLAPMLRYNLTNLLPDLLTAHLTRTLTTELTMSIGPSVLHEVTEALAPALHRQVAEVLSRAVPDGVLAVVPYLLERSLPIALTRDLTRTLTHAMVPTLSYALSRTPAQDWYCNECYQHQKHCKECHDSPYAQYYTNYYSTYYSDYFSEYYQEYYTKALLLIDQAQHPLGGSESAQKSPVAKEAVKHNLGQEYQNKPFLWQRPMTASGTPPEAHVGGPPVGPTVPAPYGDRKRMDSHMNWTHPTLKDPTKPTVQGQLWGPPTKLEPAKL